MEIAMETSKKYQEAELQKLAVARVKKLRDFYIHLFVYAIGVAVYLLKTYYGLPFNIPVLEYLNCFVMAVWTFIIVTQCISLFLSEIILGKKWEERKLKKLMQTKSEKQIWK